MHDGSLALQTHLLMVLLQEDQLLLQPFNLHLQVRPGQHVQQPLESGEVRLHRLPHAQLVLPPVEHSVSEDYPQRHPLSTVSLRSHGGCRSLVFLLSLEVVHRQLGVVVGQVDASVDTHGAMDLER